MSDMFGMTRSTVKNRYALLTAGGCAPSRLPGWERAACVVLSNPGPGARFCQILATLDRDGRGVGNSGVNEYFFYLLEGQAALTVDEKKHRLEPGAYGYVPPEKDMELSAAGTGARVLIFQKRFVPLPGVKRPDPIISHEREIKGRLLSGSDTVRLQALLPEQPAFDLAVEIITCPPGAMLPAVESRSWARGHMLLKGQAIVRLGGDWHPAQAGDAIWLAPFCPHWFVAVGKGPASYLSCADANRDLL